MADDSHPGPSTDGARSRTGLPAWVWIGMVLVAVLAALGSAWWVEQDQAAVPDEAPGRPEVFCNTVGELQAAPEVELAVGEGASGLQPSIDGLRRLQAAAPPEVIRADLEDLATALEAVQDEAARVAPGDPAALARVGGALDDRLRALQPASDRVGAYTERWCGASIGPSVGS